VVCINYLNEAVNKTIKDKLITITLPQKYHGYVSKLQGIGSKLEGLKYSSGTPRSSSSSGSQRNSSRRVVNKAATVDEGDRMDWEPTEAVKIFKLSGAEATQLAKDNANLRGKRARWVNQEEFRARREEGRCGRCGRTYCHIGICPLKGAIPPEGFRTRAAAAKPVIKAAVEDSDEEEYRSASESEN